ncbi:MAG: PAS domain-containing protein, partial [Methanobacterium sp.]|nr:PAS domain-containing protein [Methanobacterium sp.]
ARTEEALRSSRERLKRMTDSLFEGMVVVNRDGDIKFANPSAKSLLGWGEESGDIEGHRLDAVFRLKDGNTALSFKEAPWQRVLQEGLLLRNDDGVFLTANGKTLSVAYACAALPDEEGHLSAIISFRDGETLMRAQREARQASRMASVGQLAAGIAHEINTPAQYVGDNLRFVGTSLTKLLTLLDAARKMSADIAKHPETAAAGAKFEAAVVAAKMTYLAKETVEALHDSIEGVTQIGHIVSSMKAFSLPGTTQKTMTDINQALDSTITISRNEWKQVAEIETHFDPSLPAVLCHAAEINQVFLNLIVNAAHAIAASGKQLPGRVVISTSHTSGFVEIRVADTGTGVPETIKDKIFDPFFTTKDVGKGTGQGLAICRDTVVTKHRGTIDVGGKEGDGAEFIVRLPVGEEQRIST